MSEGEWWKNTSVWWNISPKEWFLSLGYHQWLMWGWLSLKGHCKALTAFYLPKVDGKNALCSEKSFFLRCSCSPLQMLLSSKPGWQNVCQHASHPSQQSGSQGQFCLSTRWWGGAAKAYFATLLCAAECCLFGLIGPVAEAWAYVVWATQPHSTASSHNKISLDAGLEHLRYKTCWSVHSWNPCSFLLRQTICFTQKLKAESTGRFLFLLNWKLKPLFS